MFYSYWYLERCKSGWIGYPGKVVYSQGYRGFESHPLRIKKTKIDYFSLNKNFPKFMWLLETSPSCRITRLRFFDFLVKMCLLNGFWWVILPVAVTLKRFLALEFVFTLGIFNAFLITPLRRFRTGGTLIGPLQEIFQFNGRSFVF